MTQWLNRGAKKTNEPTIPLIFQSHALAMTQWLNRAARAGAAAATSAFVRPKRPSSSVRPEPN